MAGEFVIAFDEDLWMDVYPNVDRFVAAFEDNDFDDFSAAFDSEGHYLTIGYTGEWELDVLTSVNNESDYLAEMVRRFVAAFSIESPPPVYTRAVGYPSQVVTWYELVVRPRSHGRTVQFSPSPGRP